MEQTKVLYEQDGSTIWKSDRFVAMFCVRANNVTATASIFVSAGFRPLGFVLFVSFNELNICVTVEMIVLNGVMN